MEKSFLSFTEAYPGWSPSGPGIEVLDNLRRFATKHESVVMSKSLHFGGAFPPRSMSPQTMGGVTTPPGSFHHHHHHANSVMRGSSIFRERNDDDAKRKKRGGKSFVDGIDDIIVTPSSSSNKFSGRSSLRRGRGGGEGEEQQFASSTMVVGDEELPLLDAWLASTASRHQVSAFTRERWKERKTIARTAAARAITTTILTKCAWMKKKVTRISSTTLRTYCQAKLRRTSI